MAQITDDFNGFIALNKPTGITSNQFLNLFKKKTKVKKCGFAGTLDPFASGVLVIGCNKATKQLQDQVNKKKSYDFDVTFGKETDTGDLEGQTIYESDKIPSEAEIKEAIKHFTGKITQAPSVFSAVKHQGSRLCDLIRAGMPLEEANIIAQSKAKEINIYSLKLSSMNGNTASMSVQCSAGTYVRKLASELAIKLQSRGYLTKLTRTSSGDFNLKDAQNQDFGISSE